MNITDNFKTTLYEILDDMSVGDVQFGVLKTFYEDGVHKLYDELIGTLSDDEMKELEAVLQRVGFKMFLYYLYRCQNKIDSCSSPTEDKECIKLVYMFNDHIRLAIFDKLQERSSFETSVMRFLTKYEIDELKDLQSKN